MRGYLGDKNGVFTPGGAGANPFVVPLIASAVLNIRICL